MSWQLSCHDICKIVTWLNDEIIFKRKRISQDFSSELIREIGPWIPLRLSIKDLCHNANGCHLQLLFTLTNLPPGQNGHHFADDIFRCIFVNEKFCILIKISLKFVPKGLIDNNRALVWIMAWRWLRDSIHLTDAYMQHQGHWWLNSNHHTLMC